MRMVRPSARHLSVGFVSVVLVMSVVISQTSWTDDRWQAIGYASTGVGFAVTAAILFNEEGQRENAWLLGALTVAHVIGQIAYLPIGPFSAPAYFIACFVHTLAAAVLLRYPSRRFDRAGLRLVQASAVLSGFFGGAHLLVGSPEWSHLHPDGRWPNFWRDAELSQAFARAQSTWLCISTVIFIVLLVRRWRRLTALERHTLAPILAAALLVAVLVGAEFTLWFAPESVAVILLPARTFSGAALALAFVVSALRLRLARTAVSDLIPRLSSVVTVEGVNDALREALSDPRAQILYWVEDQATYVTGEGVVKARPEDGPEQMVVDARSANGAPLAAVIVDPGLRRHRVLVESAVAVCGLALENARLQAGLRAQLSELRLARGRLLRAGLEERRRLERDLHDGAQQRLLAIGLRLGAIEAGPIDAATASEVTRARMELRTAMDELRSLAHGIYPAVLTQAGLAPAVEAVCERLPLPVVLDAPSGRWPLEVESTAYFVICEALSNSVKHAAARTAAVRIELVTAADGALLQVRVTDDGQGSAGLNAPDSLPHLRDRLNAAGGTLSVTSRPGDGTEVMASIPCG